MTNIKLKKLIKNEVTSNWIKWLNDRKVTKYSRNRFIKHTIESQKQFVKKKLKSNDTILFKIIYRNIHIGMIEIGKIRKNKYCHISYMIGEKKFWNKGIASKVIKKIKQYIFKNLNMNKIYAGVYENNLASFSILQKNGFRIFRKHSNFYNFGSKKVGKVTLVVNNKEK
jgi:[ribosomal protein S5]-alanine N-acetyltransferase